MYESPGKSYFGVRAFAGMDIYVSPDIPKMQLSDELIPGEVQWPPGFKAEMDAWMLSFFGTTNALEDYEVRGNPKGVTVNPRTFEAWKQQLARK